MSKDWFKCYLEFLYAALKSDISMVFVLEQMEQLLGSHDLDVFLIEARESDYPLIPDEVTVFLSVSAFLAATDNALFELMTTRDISVQVFQQIVQVDCIVILEPLDT